MPADYFQFRRSGSGHDHVAGDNGDGAGEFANVGGPGIAGDDQFFGSESARLRAHSDWPRAGERKHSGMFVNTHAASKCYATQSANERCRLHHRSISHENTFAMRGRASAACSFGRSQSLERIDPVTLTMIDDAIPCGVLRRSGRRPQPPTLTKISIDCMVDTEAADFVDGGFRGLRDPKSFLNAKEFFQRRKF